MLCTGHSIKVSRGYHSDLLENVFQTLYKQKKFVKNLQKKSLYSKHKSFSVTIVTKNEFGNLALFQILSPQSLSLKIVLRGGKLSHFSLLLLGVATPSLSWPLLSE